MDTRSYDVEWNESQKCELLIKANHITYWEKIVKLFDIKNMTDNVYRKTNISVPTIVYSLQMQD